MEQKQNMKALMIIVNAGFSEEAMAIAREQGAGGGTIINARGTGLKDHAILGIHVEPEKEMIISIVPEEVAEAIMCEIKDKKGVKTPANGICFTLPVDQMTLINKIDIADKI